MLRGAAAGFVRVSLPHSSDGRLQLATTRTPLPSSSTASWPSMVCAAPISAHWLMRPAAQGAVVDACLGRGAAGIETPEHAARLLGSTPGWAASLSTSQNFLSASWQHAACCAHGRRACRPCTSMWCERLRRHAAAELMQASAGAAVAACCQALQLTSSTEQSTVLRQIVDKV